MKTVRAPFGRMPEHVAKLSEADRARAAVLPGSRVGDDDTLKLWPTRAALARHVRKLKRNAPSSPWRPLVKLGDGEGY